MIFISLLFLLFGAEHHIAWGAASTLAKFEPKDGCYIGAFIERDLTLKSLIHEEDSGQRISEFENLTKKKHASYFTYVGYGQAFPAAWVTKVKERGAAPHIAFEPNGGLDMVYDSEYLRNWARDAARARCPIFLRWASEMNGPWTNYSRNPALYIEKFRLIASIMKEEAPNVAMVWTPFAEPRDQIPLYYPGDDYVDWVGVNIYSVYVHNGDPLQPAYQEDPIEFLRYVYNTYADRKPIHISEFAATLYCRGSQKETVDFAIQKITRFYTTVHEAFPRVKSINYFCLDTINAGLANNNYSFLTDGRALATYRKMIADNYFLDKVDYDPKQFSQWIKPGTTVVAGAGQNGDDSILGIGAVAANLDKPMLRGLHNGDIIHDDLNLRAQLPLGLQPQGIMWQVDGQTMALTNTPPYRVSIERGRLAAGHHTARVIVINHDADRTQFESPEVSFEVAQ
ncbi:MAG: hypothetical protein JO316_00155 [Abitibacteriaceae bacterium]|nr:hypothetical protein [Abditibacteriaceae bacterium]